MAKKTLTVEFDWPPKGLSPNSRLPILKKARLFKLTRLRSYHTTLETMKAQGITAFSPKLDEGATSSKRGGTVNLQLICTPPINRYRDEDNLIANCKAIFDGAAQALGVNDCCFHFREQVWHDAQQPGSLTILFDWEEE